MPEYRLYCMGGDGSFTKSREIVTDSDEAAIAFARQLKIPTKCELWERERLVAALEAHWDS